MDEVTALDNSVVHRSLYSWGWHCVAMDFETPIVTWRSPSDAWWLQPFGLPRPSDQLRPWLHHTHDGSFHPQLTTMTKGLRVTREDLDHCST